ncbi:MAG: transcription elongation factor GreA [Planctomycetes bacterium]|nr:transcription elongation factor GreA [Planctomycetota bacterium]
MDRVPVTRQGYDKLRAELDKWKNEDMPRIVAEIGRTRAFGDLSENAEYHAAREAAGQLQARINERESLLARSFIVDQSKIPTDQVAFGARVKVKDLDLDEEEEFHFVGPGQEDYLNNKVLITSPIGQGLLGKKVGETSEIKVPRGISRLQVLEISYD